MSAEQPDAYCLAGMHLPIGWTGPVHCDICGAFLYFDQEAADETAAHAAYQEAHPLPAYDDPTCPF